MNFDPHGQLPLLPRCLFLLSSFSLASLGRFRIVLELFPERNAIHIGGCRGLGCISSWPGGGEESGRGDEIRMGRCGESAVVELVAL